MPTPPKSLVNSEPVAVTHLDGTTTTAHLARLSLRQLYTFAEHVRGSRTPELVALCTGQTVEWVDSLTDESFGDLTQRCVAANFQRAMTIGDRDPVMAGIIGPSTARGVIAVSEMIKAIQPSAGTSGSNSSAAPAPSASAAVTGSASST